MKEGCAIEDGSAVGYLEKTQIPILRVRVRRRTRMWIMVQVRVMKRVRVSCRIRVRVKGMVGGRTRSDQGYS